MDKPTEKLSIGEMAKLNNTTVSTLRLYDELGLLTPDYVDASSHYRYYGLKQNARFDTIQYMKELGLELKEIKTVLDSEDLALIAGTILKKADFLTKHYVSNQIFVFVDSQFPLINETATIESGMYACIYLDNFDSEKVYAKQLLDYCVEKKYQVCGDYLCEVLTEFNLFDKDTRSMFLRLQIPIEFKKVNVFYWAGGKIYGEN